VEHGDQLRRPPGPQFERVAVVGNGSNNLSHVVRSRIAARDEVLQFGNQPVFGIVSFPMGRHLVSVIRQITEQLPHRHQWIVGFDCA